MKAIMSFILSLILVSCSYNTDGGMMEINSSRIYNHIIKIVELYIEKNPKFESYIIIPPPNYEYFFRFINIINKKGI